MLFCKIFIIFTFSVYLIVSGKVLKVGDTCIRYGQVGSYMPLSECKSAVKTLKGRGIRFSKARRSLIKGICCVQDMKNDEFDRTMSPPIKTRSFNFGKRISEIKCEEYSKHVTVEHYISTLSFNSPPKILKTPNCDYSPNPLIFGGEPTRQGEFPHMAAIGKKQEDGSINWQCGGSLISEKFVLTAGHCFLSPDEDRLDVVRLGEQNLNSVYDFAFPIDFDIKELHLHPDYVGRKYDDIALIELSRTVSINKYVRPACLWTKDNFTSENAIATGWGTTMKSSQSDELMKVGIKIFENKECAPLYRHFINRFFSNGIIDTQLCAGDLEGLKDTCSGDSGGPLQIPSAENPCVFHVVGVTSFGTGCPVKNILGVYTRVSKYIDWIEKVVWDY